jgi:sulfatase maturation enzyme AslB (radical SAM superfamily)
MNIKNYQQMKIDRTQLYRFPWSKTDNPGGWIEVTDTCNISCRGCYRNQLDGHRPVDEIKKDILDTIRLTNCDCITIAGGEPLIYPDLMEIVKFIANQKVKPIIFSNGVTLTPGLLQELKTAGLAKIHLHIDSMQQREGWTGKSEMELNTLRQYYADMIRQTGKIQCGFHVTVYRSNLNEIPRILEWSIQNLNKVQHISFIAFRTIPIDGTLSFYADGMPIPSNQIHKETIDIHEINITTEEMYEVLKQDFPFLHPCAYLNGTAVYESFKFLIMVNFGTKRHLYGNLGKKTMEMVQMFYHLLFKKYSVFLKSPKVGLKLFFLLFFDTQIKNGFLRFLKFLVKNPLSLFDAIYAQSIHLQQPNEVIDGKINLCDDCVNMMVYKGQLINSCRLDEYRVYGEALNIVKLNA